MDGIMCGSCNPDFYAQRAYLRGRQDAAYETYTDNIAAAVVAMSSPVYDVQLHNLDHAPVTRWHE